MPVAVTQLLDRAFIDKELRELRAAIHDEEKNDGSLADVRVISKDTVFRGEPMTLNPEVLRDLDVDGVAERTYGSGPLLGGAAFLREILARPIADVDVLRRRQRALRDHAKLRDFWGATGAVASAVGDDEKAVLWLLGLPEDEARVVLDILYFKTWPLKLLNRSRACLTGLNAYRSTLAPLLTIASPLTFIVVAYIAVARLGLPISPWTFAKFIVHSMGAPITNKAMRCAYLGVSFVMYVQGAVNACEFSRLVRKVTSSTLDRARRAMRFLDRASTLVARYWTPECDLGFVGLGHGDAPSVRAEENETVPTSGPGLWFVKNHDRAAILALMRATYTIDALDAVVRLEGAVVPARFAADGDRPVLLLRGLKHPRLGAEGVANDFDGRYNHVVTGANAAGKSTFLRSVGLAVLMAQSWTVVAATSAVVTPVRALFTHANVVDVVGSSSMFQAELRRCSDVLDALKRPGGAVVLLDELFRSTNARDGSVGALRVLKRLAEHRGAVVAIATHFPELAIELRDDRRFRVCGMESREDGACTFRLTLGASVRANASALVDAALEDPVRDSQELCEQCVDDKQHL